MKIGYMHRLQAWKASGSGTNELKSTPQLKNYVAMWATAYGKPYNDTDFGDLCNQPNYTAKKFKILVK